MRPRRGDDGAGDPFSADRFRLRLTLDNLLPLAGEGRSPRAFDHYLAELVRDDDSVCASLDVYFRRLDDRGFSYARAAVAQGSDYLVRVRLDALDDDGHVQEHIERAIDDVMTDVSVLDELRVLDPDADKPVLRGMFMQELSAALSRGMDIFFINAPDDDLAFWRDTLGARRVGDFIVASGARPLPIYPKPTRVKLDPQARPRLRLLGPRGEPN